MANPSDAAARPTYMTVAAAAAECPQNFNMLHTHLYCGICKPKVCPENGNMLHTPQYCRTCGPTG
jgi:hypothetical protein